MPTSDIVIIGGGIAGLSAASALSASAKVVVLEAEKSIGYHATGRSAANVQPSSPDRPARLSSSDVCAAR
ncbi:MAG: FAD-dependent oxidoreductase, partial [Rhodobacteraceae bacterium]|nr:FAD-dependent oxidoreductase [Paracoccaceae bacterium]